MVNELPPIRFRKWIVCELLRGHSYQQQFIFQNPYTEEDAYLSVCRRCNNLQSDIVMVRNYIYLEIP